MKSYKYDFHMHSCLSPCGDEDMTPNNMVNMAALLGCEIMAITDHNSCKNAGAAMRAGENAGILVVPGMELCTSEEAHVVCLFDSLEGAQAFDSYVYEKIPPVKNKADIFGRQLILDCEDSIVREEERLLITASEISANDVQELVKSFGGISFPAHIDKSSYSLLASLGAIPTDVGFTAVELTRSVNRQDFVSLHRELEGMRVFTDSDAHYLENINEDFFRLHLEELSLKAVIKAIGTPKG